MTLTDKAVLGERITEVFSDLRTSPVSVVTGKFHRSSEIIGRIHRDTLAAWEMDLHSAVRRGTSVPFQVPSIGDSVDVFDALSVARRKECYLVGDTDMAKLNKLIDDINTAAALDASTTADKLLRRIAAVFERCLSHNRRVIMGDDSVNQSTRVTASQLKEWQRDLITAVTRRRPMAYPFSPREAFTQHFLRLSTAERVNRGYQVVMHTDWDEIQALVRDIYEWAQSDNRDARLARQEQTIIEQRLKIEEQEEALNKRNAASAMVRGLRDEVKDAQDKMAHWRRSFDDEHALRILLEGELKSCQTARDQWKDAAINNSIHKVPLDALFAELRLRFNNASGAIR